MSSLRKVKSIRKILLLCLVVLGAIPNLHGMEHFDDLGDDQGNDILLAHMANTLLGNPNFRATVRNTRTIHYNFESIENSKNSDDSFWWYYARLIALPIFSCILPIIAKDVYDHFYGDQELKELKKEDAIVSIDLKRQQVKLQSQKGWNAVQFREKQEEARRREMESEGQAFVQWIQIFKAREEQLKAAINSREKAETPEERQFYDREVQRIINYKNYSMLPFDGLEFEEDEKDEEDKKELEITSKMKKSLSKKIEKHFKK